MDRIIFIDRCLFLSKGCIKYSKKESATVVKPIGILQRMCFLQEIVIKTGSHLHTVKL